MAKDRFSEGAYAYARYRPDYPDELYRYIFSLVAERNCAWDCATGNGQAARVLADYFSAIEATDISEAQLRQAVHKGNIRYSLSPAEQTPFADNSFDLITVAQAYHWIDGAAFGKEAARVGKLGCVVAAWGYNLVECSEEPINALVRRFYFETVHRYWDAERHHVEDNYLQVVFPFSSLPSRSFVHRVAWRRQDLLNYVGTWSAVKQFTNAEGRSPLPVLQAGLQQVWPDAGERKFSFPIFLRVGRVEK